MTTTIVPPHASANACSPVRASRGIRSPVREHPRIGQRMYQGLLRVSLMAVSEGQSFSLGEHRAEPHQTPCHGGLFSASSRQNKLSKGPQMIRSLHVIPATLYLAAAVVTAQAPAGDKPASNPPATQQPAGQPPAGQQPSTAKPTTSSPSSQQPSSTMAGSKMTYVGVASSRMIQPERGFSRMLKPRRLGPPAPARSERLAGSKMTLNLDPAATVNLKAHANHKVEIVGR